MRSLVEQGYLSQTGDIYTVTDKAWLEVVPEAPNLIEKWEKDRKEGWNRHLLIPFVCFDELNEAQSRYAIENAEQFEWYVLYSDITRRDTKIYDGTQQGPVEFPKGDLGQQIITLIQKGREALAKEGRGRSEWDIVLTSPALRQHVETTVATEKFDQLFKMNLRWGLVALGAATEEDAKLIVTTEEPDWVLGGSSHTNLGVDPQKWGENLDAKIKGCEESIERMQQRIKVMKDIKEKVDKLGGWDVFQQQMREKMTAELAKK
jgi:hypothetical protein